MQRKRLQNRISESRWLLAFVAPVAISVWILVSFFDHSAIPPMICWLFSTYLMLELNNANALIRIYSRMVSCTFLVLTTMATFQFTSIRSAIVVLCSVGFYTCVFRCYQDTRSQGWIFYAFLCLGLSSIVWIQTLFFVPILWILIATNLLAMSPKSFVSSLFGLIFPYFFFVGYCLATNNIAELANHFTEIANFGSLLDYQNLSLNQILSFALVLLCAVIGTIHCILQKRNDSIRTRLLYGFFITVNTAAIIFICLQPQHFDTLLSIIVVSTSPLIGHFFALTHSKLSDFTFKSLVFITLALLLFNLWTLLSNFL